MGVRPAVALPRASAVAPGAGRVGPNAITRVAEALERLEGAALCDRVFAAAGVAAYRAKPPAAMVPEADVACLQAALVETLGPRRAAHVAREAGRLTGDYLLAHRIPAPAQAVLRRLPRAWAGRILARAIARHAWTFAGSGSFAASWQGTPAFRLQRSPVCRDLHTGAPAGYFTAATLERLYAGIVHPAATVSEVACLSAGDEACLFHVHWPGLAPSPRGVRRPVLDAVPSEHDVGGKPFMRGGRP